MLRVGFKTTIEENLLSEIKIKAIQNKINVNDILEKLIEKYLNEEIQVDFNDHTKK